MLISSVNQAHANPDIAHYVASKGGVMMLGRAMALELAPHGITVNLVAPGTIETDINRDMLADPEFRARKLAGVPLRRAGTPEDVAGAVVYLASAGAGYVTGSTVTVDGGLTIRSLPLVMVRAGGPPRLLPARSKAWIIRLRGR